MFWGRNGIVQLAIEVIEFRKQNIQDGLELGVHN